MLDFHDVLSKNKTNNFIGLSVAIELRLEWSFKIDSEIVSLLRSEICEMDSELIEVQSGNFFI